MPWPGVTSVRMEAKRCAEQERRAAQRRDVSLINHLGREVAKARKAFDD